MSASPITPARALASIASWPRVGPTVLCCTTSTGTGSAPPETSAASSSASSAVKLPVIEVLPPTIPTPQRTSGDTCGEDSTALSSTIATRRCGVPGAAQAAAPVSCSQSRSPVPRNSTVTDRPPSCSTCAAALPTPSPVSAAGPIASGWPDSSATTWGFVVSIVGTGSPVAAPVTGWKVSCAVLPMTAAASSGSCTPGSSTMIRRSPDLASVGSATPSASTRLRSTSRARSVAAASARTPLPSRVSSTIWVPPRRSRPRRGVRVRLA